MNKPAILVLDNDAENGDMLRSVVHPDHVDVRVVGEEAEALRVVEEEAISLIFIQGSLPLSMECIETWKSEPSTREIPLVILATAHDLGDWLGRLPERARPEHHLLLPLQTEDLVPLIEYILGSDATWDSEPVFDAIPIDTPEDAQSDEEDAGEEGPPPAPVSPAKPPPPPEPMAIEDRINSMAEDLLTLNRRYAAITTQTEELEAAHKKSLAAWERERTAHSARVAELLEENAALKERVDGDEAAMDSAEEFIPEGEEPTTLAALEKWKENATRALHAARERVKREEEQRQEIHDQLESAHKEVGALKDLLGEPSPETEESRDRFRAMMKQLQNAAIMVEQAQTRVNAGRHHLKHRMEVVRGLNTIWEQLTTVQRSYAADAATRNAAHHLDHVLREMRDRLRELSTIMDAANSMAEAHSETIDKVFRLLSGNTSDP